MTEVVVDARPSQPSDGGADEPLAPAQLVAAVERSALAKASAPRAAHTLGMGIAAGLAIALGFAFFITVTTGAESMPWGVSRLLGGLTFSLGLILILVCGGELFTSSVLACVPWAGGRLDTPGLLRNWALVYAGNIAGAVILAALLLAGEVHTLAGGRWGANVLSIATHKLEHGFGTALALGLLCNLLVCLAVWMSHSTRRAGEKALLVMLPVALFVAMGFEHVVANLFIVPLAMGIAHDTGNAPATLTLQNFVLANLVPVTLGNILGGLAVGLGHRALHKPHDSTAEPQSAAVVPLRKARAR